MKIHEINILATPDEVNEVISEIEDDFDCSISKNTTGTMKSGSCYRLDVTWNNCKASVIAKKRDNDGMYVFDGGLKFGNMNNSFYESSMDQGIDYDENPEFFIIEMLRNLALNTCGTVVMSAEGVDKSMKIVNASTAVINGTETTFVPCGYVEETGKVYAVGKEIKDATMGTNIGGIDINKTLSEFIKENVDLQDELKKLPSTTERVEYIGKWLINKKINDEIDYDTFKEQFMQAGLMGYNDKTCSMMYKILS